MVSSTNYTSMVRANRVVYRDTSTTTATGGLEPWCVHTGDSTDYAHGDNFVRLDYSTDATKPAVPEKPPKPKVRQLTKTERMKAQLSNRQRESVI